MIFIKLLAVIGAIVFLFTGCAKVDPEAVAVAAVSKQDINQEPVHVQVTDNGIIMTWETVDVIGPELEWLNGQPNLLGQIQIPHFSGLSDKSFEQSLNEKFETECLNGVNEFKEYYQMEYDNYKNVVSGEDKELAESYKRILEAESYNSTLSTIATSEKYFAFANTVGMYMGGAHGLTVIKAYNIDTEDNKLLKLSDLFSTPDYKEALLKILNGIKDADPMYKEYLYPDQNIETLSDTGFFFSDKGLVIFYQPYEIGPYAAGFISFNIEYSKVNDILLDKYRGMDIKVVTPSAALLMNEALFKE